MEDYKLFYIRFTFNTIIGSAVVLIIGNLIRMSVNDIKCGIVKIYQERVATKQKYIEREYQRTMEYLRTLKLQRDSK